MAAQLPQTPQSPSQTPMASKTSPATALRIEENTMPTPDASVNGNLSLANVPDTAHNKRKRESEEPEARRPKKQHVEEREFGIGDLHIDVGEKYLLCRTPHPTSQPDLSLDLFALAGLTPIALRVARTLPNGLKNGLRKTYKGKIKDLGISGKFDVAPQPHDQLDAGLLAMMAVPDDEWHVQHVRGHDILLGLGTEARSSLPVAMTMARGPIPKSQWDSSVLGDADVPGGPTKASAPSPVKGGTPSVVGTPISATSMRSGLFTAQRSVSSPDVRPKRKVKQRSYGDDSFEGYGDGYVDDDAVGGGYSTGDDEKGKRRKSSASSHHRDGPRQNSYGPGMVGA